MTDGDFDDYVGELADFASGVTGDPLDAVAALFLAAVTILVAELPIASVPSVIATMAADAAAKLNSEIGNGVVLQ